MAIKRNGIIIVCILCTVALGYVLVNYQKFFGNMDLLDFERSVVRAHFINSTNDVIETHALINKERAKHGLSELILYSHTSTIAQERADCMAGINDRKCPFVHSDDMTLIKACRHQRSAGENIFMSTGYAEPSVAVEGWMNSSGHRANILLGHWQSEGIGVGSSIYGTYYVQIFCAQ